MVDENGEATTARAIRRGKLAAPEASEDYVTRPRINDLLDVDVPVILMVAPAGFGKTTALAGWQRHASRPVAWFTADTDDAEVSRFAIHMVDAIAERCPGFGEGTRRELQVGSWSPRSLAQAMLDDLVDLADPSILVIDDFQEIQNGDVSALIAELLRVPPRNLRMVFSSRWDPNIPLARLRAQGMVQEVRASDLRFSEEESCALLSAALGATPDESVVDVLYKRTDGWAAGLRLAGIALRSAGDASQNPEQFLVSGERHLMNFLMDEVLSRQPELVRQLLLKTSILDRVCSSLADVLVDVPADVGSSEAMLASLATAGIFEERRENGRAWYYCHELFRDLLRHRLSMEMTSEDVVALKRRAIDWLAAHGYIGDAIEQALKADDVEHAADLIEQSRTVLLGREEWQELDSWVRQLPESVIQQRPQLQLTRLRTAIFRGVVTGGHHDFQILRGRVEAMAGLTDADTLRKLSAEVDLLDVHKTFFAEHDPEYVAKVAERVLANLPSEDGSGRGIAIMAWTEANLCLGREQEALRRLAETLASERDDSGVYVGRVLLAQAMVFIRLGRLKRSEQVLRYLMQLAEERHLRLLGAWARWGLGSLAYERNDLDEAESCFTRILSAPQDVHYRTLSESLIGLVLVANARHDTELVEATMARLVQVILERGPLSGLEIVDSLQVRLGLINRETSVVGRLDMVPTNRTGEQPYSEFPLLTRAKLQLHLGTLEAIQGAIELTEELEQWASRFNERRRLVEILLIRAAAYSGLGDRDAAVEVMMRALTLVGDQPYARTFLDIGFDLRPLLALVRESGHDPPNLQRITALLDSGGTQPHQSSQHEGTRETVRDTSMVHVYELLTQREVSVLQCIGEHLTNQEIADRLFISPLTVKRHASNIYDKLGVNSRRQAIIKATEMGYL